MQKSHRRSQNRHTRKTSLLFLTIIVLSVFVPLLHIPAAQGVVIETENYESGATDWTADDNSADFNNVTTNAAINGTYGLNVTSTGNDLYTRRYYELAEFSNETWLDFYVKLNDLTIYQFGDDWGTLLADYQEDSGSLNRMFGLWICNNGSGNYWRVTAYGATPVNNYTSVPTEGATYHVRMQLTRDVSAVFNCWINGVLVASGSGFNNTGYGEIRRIRVGLVACPNEAGVRQNYSFDTIQIAEAEEDYTPNIDPILTVTHPGNITYPYAYVPIKLSASAGVGTIDDIWFNCKNGTNWIFASNQTYTSLTNRTFSNGTYTFFAYANNTEGTIGSANVTFTVGVDADLPFTSGDNICYANGTELYFRGVGLAGFAPDLIMWNSTEEDSWTLQWTAVNDDSVNQTFAALRDTWHCNLVRFFVYPEWIWLDNVTTAVSGKAENISTRGYIKTLASIAAEYGIYLNIVPYELTAKTGSFDHDPYLSDGGGLPMCGDWDTNQTAFINDAGYTGNETGFWQDYYTLVGNEFKAYPNIIWEAWNEPNFGNATQSNIVPLYMTYLTTMYNSIRATGANNLIMYQWEMGWEPNGWGMNLRWAAEINGNLTTPINVVYTTHFYYYAPADLTRYWNQGEVSASDGGEPKTAAQLTVELQALKASMGVTAPLVINEEGDSTLSPANVTKDRTWWTNILEAQNATGLGAVAYYWLSDGGLGGVYNGETMLSEGAGYTPNTMGQIFIDAYTPSGSEPEPTPTPTATPTVTATPAPSVASNLPTLNMDWLWVFLYSGDFFGFFQALFLTAFNSANILYGALVLLFIVPIYLRSKSLLLICILWIMIGGFFVVAFPIVAGMSIIFLAMGIGGLFYRIIRPNS